MELVTGSSPYSLDRFHTEFALLSHIVDADPPLPDKEKFSTEFYSFVAQWCVCVCVCVGGGGGGGVRVLEYWKIVAAGKGF